MATDQSEVSLTTFQGLCEILDRDDLTNDEIVEMIFPGARAREERFQSMIREIRAVGPIFVPRDALPIGEQ